MSRMFSDAKIFSGDISQWDVSSVITMDNMFFDAASFKHKLCRPAWVNSKASKIEMFTGSFGLISQTVCSATLSSGAELKRAVVECLKLSPQGDCPNGPHGPIGEWDVSSVADMSKIFDGASFFNADISKWDVSRVTTMSTMFVRATSFNGDLSKWDVSTVANNMYGMFRGAKTFNSDISKWDVSSVTNMYDMFMDAAAFNIDISKWDVSSVITMDYMFWQAASFKQKLCGAAWVHSKASKKHMFASTFPSISSQVCTLATPRQYASRRPIPGRELIVRAPITTSVITRTLAITSSNNMTCPKCDTFEKSGRISCCAPGGAWYKKCGGVSNINADHSWYEGVKACRRKSKANAM